MGRAIDLSGRDENRTEGGEGRTEGGESPSAETDIDSDSHQWRLGYRAQVHVIGLVLLVGVVTVAMVGVFVLGSAALDTREATVETERAEASLLSFAHAAETAAVSGERSSPASIGPFDRGDLETRDDGRMTVTHVTDDGDEVVYDESIGTIAYENGDAEIAYQGGGVWRQESDGTATVSAPPIDYRSGTLSVPVVRLDGADSAEQSIDGTVTRSSSPTSIDLPGSERPYETADLRIEIESKYCEGWERELESTVPGNVTERCADGQSDRVRFELSAQPRIDAVDSAVVAPEIDVGHEANRTLIEGDVRTDSVDEDLIDGTVYGSGYDARSLDSTVSAAVEHCDEFAESPDEITDPGRHCVESIDDGLVVDTDAGDVELVVRDSIGDPTLQDDLRVEGANDLTIYLDGDLSVAGNAAIGNASDPGQTRVLVADDAAVTTATGTPSLAALLYAPDSTVTLQGNPTLEGSVVADRVEIPNVNEGVVRYDEGVKRVDFVPGSGTHLGYLDATAYELSIDD